MSDKLQGPWKIRYENERYYVSVDGDSKFDEIKAERDELLELLEEALEDWDFDEPDCARIEWADKARAAILKAKGE